MGITANAKAALALLGDLAGLSRLGLETQKALRLPFIRAINYHDVPDSEAAVFESQLELFARHFVPVGLEDLLSLAAGHWPHDKPGLIISFDDGLASHARVAAPLLDRYGFIGWFMVPTGFVDAPVASQIDFAASHSIVVRKAAQPGERIALGWDEIRALSRRHVIGAHTVDHVRFSDERSSAELDREATDSRIRLEQELGQPVEVFAWVGGEEESYSTRGAQMIRKAGYRVSFMTNNAIFRPGDDLLQVQRTNIETSYSPALTKLHLSGLYDLLYLPKRRRVRSVTNVD